MNNEINFQKYNFVKEVKPKNELIGRREELMMLKESMYKKRMKNTILVGKAGCGKTAILEQFAFDMGHFFKILEIDIGSIVAGTTLRGEFEEKLINFLNDCVEYNKINSNKIILFIDEIHNLYKAGGAEGAVDGSNIIKTYLSKGDVTLVGATTIDEYKATIAKDKALNRRLCPIYIKDLDDETNIKILLKFNDGLLSEDVVKYIYEESKKTGKTNPDISIEILDRCMARQKFTGNYSTVKTVKKVLEYMNEEI